MVSTDPQNYIQELASVSMKYRYAKEKDVDTIMGIYSNTYNKASDLHIQQKREQLLRSLKSEKSKIVLGFDAFKKNEVLIYSQYSSANNVKEVVADPQKCGSNIQSVCHDMMKFISYQDIGATHNEIELHVNSSFVPAYEKMGFSVRKNNDAQETTRHARVVYSLK